LEGSVSSPETDACYMGQTNTPFQGKSALIVLSISGLADFPLDYLLRGILHQFPRARTFIRYLLKYSTRSESSDKITWHLCIFHFLKFINPTKKKRIAPDAGTPGGEASRPRHGAGKPHRHWKSSASRDGCTRKPISKPPPFPCGKGGGPNRRRARWLSFST